MNETIIVCTTPRSGSNYLGDLFKENGVGWLGESLYNAQSLKLDNVTNVQYRHFEEPEFTTKLLKDYITESHNIFKGRIAVKMMGYAWNHLLYKVGGVENMPAYFGKIQYIHLRRINTWRQAISFYIAERTNVWYNSNPTYLELRSSIAFDFDKINKCRLHATKGHAAFEQFFSKHQIEPIEIAYEDLADNYQPVFLRTMQQLGWPLEKVVNGKARIQSDELNEKFYQLVLQHIEGKHESEW